MNLLSRCAARLALGVLVCLLPSVVSAQDLRPSLRMPTIAASAAAAADWASTYHALKYYRVREVNPLLQPFQQSPAAMVAVGALIDFGGVSAWNSVVGRTHPRVATAGLWSMALFRTYLAVHNMRNERIAGRR